MGAAQRTPERMELERQAAAVLELRSRRQSEKTVYGIYRPTGEYGGELLRCIQERGGEYVEVDATPTVSIPEKLEPALITPKRFKIIFGGRSSAKSHGVGDIFSAKAKDYGHKTLCLREMQNTIEDSVHALLAALIRDHQWTDFDITEKAIRLKGEDVFKFKGLARNVDGVKSAYGFMNSWVEEAQVISLKSLEELTPTIREAGAELWFTLNPGSSADPMSQRFLQPFYSQLLRDRFYEDDLHLVIWMNYEDNPWHGELEPERLYDYENKSKAEYRHKWLGYYNDEVANSIITVEEFDAAVDAHTKLGFKPTGAKIAAYDPSDLGPDDKGYVLRHGSVVLDVQARSIGDVNEGTDWALGLAVNAGADHFVWDCDGMGVSLKRQVSEALDGKHIAYHMFKGSESPENPDAIYEDTGEYQSGNNKSHRDTFFNKRAQYYIKLADRFKATHRAVENGEYINPDDMISLSPDLDCLDQLRAEVCRIPRRPNANGKIQIMSKIEMAKKPYELPSPNLADSMMMSMISPIKRGKTKGIKFEAWT